MGKGRWFGLLALVMLLTSACAMPVEMAQDVPQVVTESGEQTQPQLLFETQAEPGVHTECTLHQDESCEFMAQQPTNDAESDALQLQNPNTLADQLLLDFEMRLYPNAYQGDITWFSDFFANGKPTVLVFWAGSCPVCRRELPEIQSAYDRYGDRVNFVGIDVGMFTNLGSREDAQQLIDELALSFPLGIAMDFNVLPTYQITAVPTTLFMLSDGSILHKENSLLNLEAIIERVETLLDYSES